MSHDPVDGAAAISGSCALWKVAAESAEACERAEPESVRALRLARDYLRQRRRRTDAFGTDIFREPAWDIVLDLFCARATGRRVSIMAACIAAGVPHTTGLRNLERLLAAQLICRRRDANDRRRSWVELSDDTARRIETWLLTSWPDGR